MQPVIYFTDIYWNIAAQNEVIISRAFKFMKLFMQFLVTKIFGMSENNDTKVAGPDKS